MKKKQFALYIMYLRWMHFLICLRQDLNIWEKKFRIEKMN